MSRRKVIRCGGRSCDRGSGHLEPSASGFRGSPRQHRSPPSLASESLGTRDASDFQLAAAAPALPGTRKPPHPTLARVISGTRSCVLAEAPSQRLRHLRVNTRDFK